MKNTNQMGKNLGKKIGMVLIADCWWQCRVLFKQAKDHRKWWRIE